MSPQRHFREELDRLNSLLVSMAGLAEQAVRLAAAALLERDQGKAQEVIRRDGDIDALELAVDDAAIQLLALQQPMAGDLRFITMAMKISNDLERVGDHAVNIAEEVEHMLQVPPFPALAEIEEMARLSTDMLNDALDAFVHGNSALARRVVVRDDRVDELHDNVFRILLTHMMEQPRRIGAGLDLLLVSRNLERIADLATNVAEDVVYFVEGRTIKHRAELRQAEESEAAEPGPEPGAEP
ncbi:MAG: phosphate signaling complex protein PhoU [Gemmatimonadetes bacterium]|nr:phosphate signaling complex protein PhoU [Gemmatimonadota bacterium]